MQMSLRQTKQSKKKPQYDELFLSKIINEVGDFIKSNQKQIYRKMKQHPQASEFEVKTTLRTMTPDKAPGRNHMTAENIIMEVAHNRTVQHDATRLF